jgi:hypothetical protein
VCQDVHEKKQGHRARVCRGGGRHQDISGVLVSPPRCPSTQAALIDPGSLLRMEPLACSNHYSHPPPCWRSPCSRSRRERHLSLFSGVAVVVFVLDVPMQFYDTGFAFPHVADCLCLCLSMCLAGRQDEFQGWGRVVEQNKALGSGCGGGGAIALSAQPNGETLLSLASRQHHDRLYCCLVRTWSVH